MVWSRAVTAVFVVVVVAVAVAVAVLARETLDGLDLIIYFDDLDSMILMILIFIFDRRSIDRSMRLPTCTPRDPKYFGKLINEWIINRQTDKQPSGRDCSNHDERDFNNPAHRNMMGQRMQQHCRADMQRIKIIIISPLLFKRPKRPIKQKFLSALWGAYLSKQDDSAYQHLKIVEDYNQAMPKTYNYTPRLGRPTRTRSLI